MSPNITGDDEGKRVVNANGEKIGLIEDVEGGTAYVDPDPGITDTIASKLGWGDADEETYALEESNVESVTDDEIRLQRL
ncbi:PRC-barrel domain containing protein [Natrialbaceae archaeon AArc-T1-2]|uniref:PRC-barrel domain containing protein n=1 Tax=Natrialbaceae archaeon AArc-T1-2 TaxID=3053904 RepID=UPI00255ABEDC|nr:PRC-barrel domain containing protein [Natrialbaceae archaeon AArc-T1-2]WIV65815.1 PRC-barrel domain containing protein [Natrialbaceae archaeon AArc-T1-2]